jgi:hypothetical protein
MLQLIGFFAALFAGGGAVGAVLGAVLGATLGRVLHRAKRPLNTAGHAIGVGLAAPIYAEYVGLGPVAPDWLFWVGVTLVAFLLVVARPLPGAGDCGGHRQTDGSLLGPPEYLLAKPCGVHHIGCPTSGTHCPTSGLVLTPRPPVV